MVLAVSSFVDTDCAVAVGGEFTTTVTPFASANLTLSLLAPLAPHALLPVPSIASRAKCAL